MSDDDGKGEEVNNNDAVLLRARASRFRNLSPQDCHDLFAYYVSEIEIDEFERLREGWKRDDMELDVPAVAASALVTWNSGMEWSDLSHGRVKAVDVDRLTAVLLRIVEQNHFYDFIWDNIVAHDAVRAALHAHPTLVVTVLAACRTQKMFNVVFPALWRACRPPPHVLVRVLDSPFAFKNRSVQFKVAATDPKHFNADIVERFLSCDKMQDPLFYEAQHLHSGWIERIRNHSRSRSKYHDRT